MSSPDSLTAPAPVAPTASDTPTTPVVPLADCTTWAKQNPSVKVQPLTDPKRKLTVAEKATRKVASAQRKESQAALNATIAKYLQHRAEKFEK